VFVEGVIMMNPKLTVSLALALGMSAAGAAYSATPFVGPYVGAQVGYSVYDIEENATLLSSDGMSASGAEGGVYGGWGMKLTPTTYAGIEAEYNWSGAEHTTTGGSTTVKIEDADNYGISARLGWLPSSNVMLYGRLGWQRATLDYTFSDPGGSATFDQDHDGLRVGLGAEVAISSNLLMRMDYAHTMYDDVSFGGANFEPDNDVFRIGVGFQF
jgi:outer membrane immunogenic protein